jgi:hypothetical protein
MARGEIEAGELPALSQRHVGQAAQPIDGANPPLNPL